MVRGIKSRSMTNLKSYPIDFERGLSYFDYSLKDINTLSSLIFNSVDFKNGNFCTILPAGVVKKNVYSFKYGGIVADVPDEVNKCIYNYINSRKNLECIFDDSLETFTEDYKNPLFLKCGIRNNNEVYYLITKKNASIELIDKCFDASNAIWHSLCVVSKIHLDRKREISKKDFHDICSNAQLILSRAYDGEGFVFWERKPYNIKSSFEGTHQL